MVASPELVALLPVGEPKRRLLQSLALPLSAIEGIVGRRDVLCSCHAAITKSLFFAVEFLNFLPSTVSACLLGCPDDNLVVLYMG